MNFQKWELFADSPMSFQKWELFAGSPMSFQKWELFAGSPMSFQKWELFAGSPGSLKIFVCFFRLKELGQQNEVNLTRILTVQDQFQEIV